MKTEDLILLGLGAWLLFGRKPTQPTQPTPTPTPTGNNGFQNTIDDIGSAIDLIEGTIRSGIDIFGNNNQGGSNTGGNAGGGGSVWV